MTIANDSVPTYLSGRTCFTLDRVGLYLKSHVGVGADTWLNICNPSTYLHRYVGIYLKYLNNVINYVPYRYKMDKNN